MSVFFSGVITREENIKTCNRDEKHCSAKNMSSRVWCNADAVNSVGGIKVDCFDKRERREMVMFCV